MRCPRPCTSSQNSYEVDINPLCKINKLGYQKVKELCRLTQLVSRETEIQTQAF